MTLNIILPFQGIPEILPNRNIYLYKDSILFLSIPSSDLTPDLNIVFAKIDVNLPNGDYYVTSDISMFVIENIKHDIKISDNVKFSIYENPKVQSIIEDVMSDVNTDTPIELYGSNSIGENLIYNWKIHGGVFSVDSVTDKSINVLFRSKGNYEIILTVTDKYGNSSTSKKQITIERDSFDFILNKETEMELTAGEYINRLDVVGITNDNIVHKTNKIDGTYYMYGYAKETKNNRENIKIAVILK